MYKIVNTSKRKIKIGRKELGINESCEVPIITEDLKDKITRGIVFAVNSSDMPYKKEVKNKVNETTIKRGRKPKNQSDNESVDNKEVVENKESEENN